MIKETQKTFETFNTHEYLVVDENDPNIINAGICKTHPTNTMAIAQLTVNHYGLRKLSWARCRLLAWLRTLGWAFNVASGHRSMQLLNQTIHA